MIRNNSQILTAAIVAGQIFRLRVRGEAIGGMGGSQQMLFHLVKKGLISQTEAAEEAGLTEEVFLKRMEEAGIGV